MPSLLLGSESSEVEGLFQRNILALAELQCDLSRMALSR